jgi:hypothetical protein
MPKGFALSPLDTEAEYSFLRPVEWSCGTFHTYWGRFAVHATGRQIRVEKLRPWPLAPEWTECFPRRRYPWRLLNGEREMASKWIKAAVAKRKASKPTALTADPALCDGRPALTDFMTDLEGPNGGVREPSALMVCFTPEGVRAGLKDDDAGGWCWREGTTLSGALDAIEKALQAGEGAFRQARAAAKKKGR